MKSPNFYAVRFYEGDIDENIFIEKADTIFILLFLPVDFSESSSRSMYFEGMEGVV